MVRIMNAEVSLEIAPISDHAFERFRRFIYETAGINLAPHKRQLVSSRLQKRLRHFGLRSYDDYLELVTQPDQIAERQHLIDLLTTNETYFYREPAHFEFLLREIVPRWHGRPLRAWSAACSSGEEAYTLAMTLAEACGNGNWQVLGSDISSRMVAAARRGVYPLDRARALPNEWLRKYCLKGVRQQAGNLAIAPEIKARVRFEERNLKQPRTDGAVFDVIFLRNVLIYFDHATKQQVIDSVLKSLTPGGYFFISHVETLHAVDTDLQVVRPSIFRRPVHPGKRSAA